MAWLGGTFMVFALIGFTANMASVCWSIITADWLSAVTNLTVSLVLLWLYGTHQRDIRNCIKVYKESATRGEVQ